MSKRLFQLCLMFFFSVFTLEGCWIDAVNEDDGDGSDSTRVFSDVSDANIPGQNLSGRSTKVQAADIDGDDDPDLIVAVSFRPNKILVNDGEGFFTDESETRLPSKDFDSQDIAVADFNNNGSPDLVFTSAKNQTNEYYLNDGSGHFSDVSQRLGVSGASNVVLTTDINRDGSPDLIIGNDGRNELLINNGRGFFSIQSSERLPETNNITQDLAMGDIDNDGDADLLVANEDNNRVQINNGNGYFVDRTQTHLPLRQGIEESRKVVLTDIDQDSDLDLYFGNVVFFQSGNSAQDRLLSNTQGGFFNDVTQARLPVANTNTVAVEFFDADGDGDQDIIIGDFKSLNGNSGNYSGQNSARVFINNGRGFFSDQTSAYLPAGFSPKAADFEVADFNGDGLMDIYVASFGSADLLLMQQLD